MIYLLHFDTPYKHARHYIGYTNRDGYEARLAEHKSGHGARILQIVAAAGIGWTVARTWADGTRKQERKLKNRHGAARFCPLCKVKSDATLDNRTTSSVLGPRRTPPKAIEGARERPSSMG